MAVSDRKNQSISHQDSFRVPFDGAQGDTQKVLSLKQE